MVERTRRVGLASQTRNRGGLSPPAPARRTRKVRADSVGPARPRRGGLSRKSAPAALDILPLIDGFVNLIPRSFWTSSLTWSRGRNRASVATTLPPCKSGSGRRRSTSCRCRIASTFRDLKSRSTPRTRLPASPYLSSRVESTSPRDTEKSSFTEKFAMAAITGGSVTNVIGSPRLVPSRSRASSRTCSRDRLSRRREAMVLCGQESRLDDGPDLKTGSSG